MRHPVHFVPYPPTSFPFRDLLVLEQMNLRPADDVGEIGVGSGETSARLARLCASVTGIDIAESVIARLAYLEGRHENLRLRVADAARPETFEPLRRAFSRVVSCDTLEHVTDPAAYFESIHTCLAPGGECLITFPNEPRASMHGVTRFDTVEELRATVERSGLVDVRIGAANLSPRAARIAEGLGFQPLRMVRRLLGAGTKAPAVRPQTFEETRFHAQSESWKRVAPLVNGYWFAVLKLMGTGDRAFVVDWGFERTDFEHCQVLICARRVDEERDMTSSVPSESAPRAIGRSGDAQRAAG